MDLPVAYGLADKIQTGEIVVNTAEPGDEPIDIGHALAWELLRDRPDNMANLGLSVCTIHGLIGAAIIVCCRGLRAGSKLSPEPRRSAARNRPHPLWVDARVDGTRRLRRLVAHV